MIESAFKPVYVRGIKRQLGFLKMLKKYYFSREKYPLLTRSVNKLLQNDIRMRKELFFTKNIIFNGKLYFSPAVPAYPSKAFDNTAAHGGLNFFDMGTPGKTCVDSLFLAISAKCPLDCKHCYETHNLNKNNNGVETERWKEVIDEMQKAGTNTIIFTGGEPLMEFDKLIKLLNYGNKDLSDFHIHTSGWGLTDSMVKEMKAAGLKSAAVGLDDCSKERFEKLRNKKGVFGAALNALELFNQNGILTYVNTCVSKEFLNSGDMFRFFDLMKDYNVSFVQLLEPKPWGGYINKNGENLFTKEDKSRLTEFARIISTGKKYRNHPVAYYIGLIESPENLGCTMGGLSHMHIDSAGNVNPCVFLPVSFGNIKEESFIKIYGRMREAIKSPPRKECPSISLRKSISISNLEHEMIPLRYENIKQEFDNAVSTEHNN